MHERAWNRTTLSLLDEAMIFTALSSQTQHAPHPRLSHWALMRSSAHSMRANILRMVKEPWQAKRWWPKWKMSSKEAMLVWRNLCPSVSLRAGLTAVLLVLSLSDSAVTSDDLLAWLHPFCGDAALPVRPRIDVLQILESNFSLRDSDVRLLLLYRTQAVLKGREVTRCARKRSGGRGSSAPLEESAGMRYLRNNFTTLPLDSMGARDGSFFFSRFLLSEAVTSNAGP